MMDTAHAHRYSSPLSIHGFDQMLCQKYTYRQKYIFKNEQMKLWHIELTTKYTQEAPTG